MLRAVPQSISNILRFASSKDKQLITAIKSIAGKSPRNLSLYKLALSHSSIAKVNKHGYRESNERLEYLGDAILGSIVAEFLYKKFPFKDEGFLTEIRSRIVNRESLNLLGKKIGIANLLKLDNQQPVNSNKSLIGNTLEAFVGAIYLDRGYRFCTKYVNQKLIIPHFDFNQLINTNLNHKSKLIEWVQSKGQNVNFEIVEIKNFGSYKEFTAQVLIDNVLHGTGYGRTKKKAEQDAAAQACKKLKIDKN